MKKLQQTLLKMDDKRFDDFFKYCKDKKKEGERFRLLEYDIIESKYVFRMLSYFCFDCGIPERETRDFLQNITQRYFEFVNFGSGYDRCTEPNKLKLFCREVIDRTVETPVLRDRLKEITSPEKIHGLSENQELCYRAFMLLIPITMRQMLTAFNLLIPVIGFDPELIEEN